MGMLDPTTGEYNEGAFALDTHAATAGDGSIFDSLQNVITKGLPLTGLSIVNSFANTAVDIGNILTGGNTERYSMADELGDGDMLDYYKQHSLGIETAGLAIGSLAPGLTAVKGWNAAMAAVKASKLMMAGETSSVMAQAVGILPAIRKANIVDNALKEINEGNGIYNLMSADKLKAIAYGAGDQALQSIWYEAATVATMKASPLLDQEGVGDVADNMFYGALTGGGIGGLLEGIAVRGIFNKALLFADNATKPQELSTRLGLGGYFEGDRAVSIVKSIDDIPTPSTVLGNKKLGANYQNAVLDAKKALATLVPTSDNEVTNSMFDMLLRVSGKTSNTDAIAGSLGREDMYNYLARLNKVERITQPPTEASPNDSIFYVGSSAAKDATSAGDIVTNLPRGFSPANEWESNLLKMQSKSGAKDFDYQLGYRMSDGASEIKVSRFDDMVSWEGGTVPRYDNKTAAFDDGADIFIDKNLRVQVNPSAPNIERAPRAGESRALTAKEEVAYRNTGKLPATSKPLLGAPVVMNTIDGSITENAIPVVGDYGTPTLYDKGLLFGGKSSPQSVASGFSKDMSVTDANARYVWSAMRDIKNGDAIAPNDIPMMEQLYRQVLKDKEPSPDAWMQKRGINVTDNSYATQNDLLNAIRNAKDNHIAEVIGADPKMSSEEVALRANVPEQYIASGMKATAPSEYMRSVDDYSRVNHVRMSYNIGNIYQQDGQIMRGMIDQQYRVNIIKEIAKAQSANFFGPDFDQYLFNNSSIMANIRGTGPGFLSFSNSDYNSLGQEAERIGRNVSKWQTQRMQIISKQLAPAVNAIRDDPASSAELGMFRNVRQRTGQKYEFLSDQLAQKYGMAEADGHSNMAVLSDSLVRNKAGTVTDWNQTYTPDGFVNAFHADIASDYGVKDGLFTSYRLSEKVANFERANRDINDYRNAARNDWYSAQGLTRRIDQGTLYSPPIDTNKYPHFALVRVRQGMGGSDDGVSMIVAENAKDLEQKIASLGDEFDVYTKDQLKKYHEVLGDYQYNRNFANSYVDSQLLRRGVLNNVYPDTRADTIIRDYTDWHTRQELRLARDHVELGNGQLFAELRAMGERFTSPETSKAGFVASLLGRNVPNPYNSYLKTALNVSERDEYRLWADANEKAETYFSTAFRVAKDAFTAANKGMISYEDASAMAERFGLGNPYKAATNAASAYYDVANKLPPARYLTKFVSTANSILGASIIKLDSWQQLVHAVSNPILTATESSSVGNLLKTELPDGSGRQIPSVTKVLYNAIQNFFDQGTRAKYEPLYQTAGAIRTPENEYHQMVDSLTLPYGKWSENGMATALSRAVEIGSKYSGANASERFTSWFAADAARQLFEAAGYEGKQLTDNIGSFVNRVKGNIISSQRPVAFQGPIGQAVGLFQTYQFNLYQQVFRYVENKELKTLMLGAALQNTVFGVTSLPGFQLINQSIIGNAAGNPTHKDLYNASSNFFDPKLANWLLYGSLSNVTNAGLYTRGDINPRQITLLPVNPLDYPSIAGGVRFVGDLIDTASKIAKGGDLVTSLLTGLEHNALSRPLQGLAQLALGYSTTAKGSLISANNQSTPGTGDNTLGWSELISSANFARLGGARPLDEAIALEMNYRKTMYQAKDTARIDALGQAVKTTMYNNQSPSDEQVQGFAGKYAAAGGDVTNFGRKMLEWSQDANASVANRIFRNLKNPMNQQMMQMMGGQPLPDFRNIGSTAASQPGLPNGSATQ